MKWKGIIKHNNEVSGGIFWCAMNVNLKVLTKDREFLISHRKNDTLYYFHGPICIHNFSRYEIDTHFMVQQTTSNEN